ncbi:DNA-binding barrel domain superfamily [Sesbania bispinosa]|nr:DNA-binding barrel domain superfamily [Sesbania bispinosa]
MATTFLPGRNANLPIHFFKIILETNVERLKIPNKFTKRHEGGFSNPVFIKPPDGTEWEVYWTKQNDEIWFEKGWKEFAENYSLNHGHLVLFKYEGTSQFDVLILDQSAVEIDYPSNDTPVEDDNLDHHSDDESIRILEGIPPNLKARPKSPLSSPQSHKKMRNNAVTHGNVESNSNKRKLHAGDQSDPDQGKKFQKTSKHELKDVEKTTERNLSLNTPRTLKAQEIAKKFSTGNPFFTVDIKQSHLEKKAVKHVPKFLDCEGKEHYARMQLGERWWTVKLVRYPNMQYDRLTSGWSLFATESKLEVGNVVIFEVVDRQVPVLKVHVFD